MRGAFNKYGSIEIENSVLKYRISIQELGVDDPLALEKEIKRKIQQVKNEDSFLLPFEIKVINRYMVFYYDLSHFVSIDYLREVDLIEKIPYYLSLIELAKEQENGNIISWERSNFICDKYSQSFKVFLFETESINVYAKPDDILKTTKDLIITTMTTLNSVISLPKRHDFINASEENIQFVENVYRMENLDDLYMYIETISLDIEQKDSFNVEIEDEEGKAKKPLIQRATKKEKKKPVKAKAKPKNKNDKYSSPQKKKRRQTKEDKMMKYGFIFVPVALVLYLISPLLTGGSGGGTDEIEVVPIDYGEATEFFKGSSEYNNDLVQAYRNAYNSNYEESLVALNNIDKSDLNESDVPLLIKVSNETGQLPKLLDEMPIIANDVITHLLTNNQLEKLTEISAQMETKNPYIEFEKAFLNQEYEYMLSLVNDIDINGRKETQIIDAYLNLEQVSEARKFAEDVGNPDLIKQVEEFQN